MLNTGTIPKRLLIATLLLLTSKAQATANSPIPQVTISVDHPMLVLHTDDKGQSDTTAMLTVVGTNFHSSHTHLTVDLEKGTVETLTFDSSNPDHRTRISVQKNQSPPTH